MKVKIFTPDSNGRISFTKKELQALLDEVYKEGYNDARPYYWSWTYPVYCGGNTITATNTTDPIWKYDYSTTDHSITASNITNSDISGQVTIPKPEDYKVEFK